eukprot:scaffold94532_cov75-Phaeocystis_antarctica.AAC.2
MYFARSSGFLPPNRERLRAPPTPAPRWERTRARRWRSPARKTSTTRAARARPPNARSRALCRKLGTMSRCGPRTRRLSIASGD